MFSIECCYIFGFGRGNCLMVVMIYYIICGKYIFNVGLGCIIFKVRFDDYVVVFYFKLIFENL